MPVNEHTQSGETSCVLNTAWLADDDVSTVMEALCAEGASARFVGGCVRNALMQVPVSDLDVAIDRPPTETMRLLEKAGLKALPTGFDHGTVTTLTPKNQQPIEITSLRRDVATDGRRAVVAFTEDWREDACRRDFTMNALYADAHGVVFDPLGQGLADLTARHIAFIGQAAERIREDRLRILRFFRFFAYYGAEGGYDLAALEDIQALKALVRSVAQERIGQEMRKLLASQNPTSALQLMHQTGVLEEVLTADTTLQGLPKLITLEQEHNLPSNWLRRLALISRLKPAELMTLLRLSKTERRYLELLHNARILPPIAAGFRHGFQLGCESIILNALDTIEGATDIQAAFDETQKGANAVFPLHADDLFLLGFAPGPIIGQTLRILEQAWLDSHLTISRNELLVKAQSAL